MSRSYDFPPPYEIDRAYRVAGTPVPGGEVDTEHFVLDREDDRLRLGFQATTERGDTEIVVINMDRWVSTDLFETLQRQFSSTAQSWPALLDMYRTPARQKAIHKLLSIASRDAFDLQEKDIRDACDVSEETIRQNIDALVEYGILRVRDPDVKIPHYRLADTQVTRLLERWDGTMPGELFTPGRHAPLQLAGFFLYEATPGEWYSKNQIVNTDWISYEGFNGHINRIVESGIATVREAEADRTAREYAANRQSGFRTFLLELNAAAQHAYQNRWERQSTSSDG